MAAGTVAFALAAGVLSTLSPCVVPILPVVFGAATAEHRWAPVALATGIALSFTAVGLFIATVGFSLGVSADLFRAFGALILIAFGLVMMVPRLQASFALAAARLTSRFTPSATPGSFTGVWGQFALGLTLGIVWSPCTGPTLGAATVLASQGRELPEVALTMLAFGLGAALPLALVGAASRRMTLRWRTSLVSVGERGKFALGLAAGLMGLALITGLNQPIETFLVNATPAWLTDLTTRF